MKRNDKRHTDLSTRKTPPVLVERECPSRREPVPAILNADGTSQCAVSHCCHGCDTDGYFAPDAHERRQGITSFM